MNTVKEALTGERKEGDCCSECVCSSCAPTTDTLPPLITTGKLKPREEVTAYTFPSLVKRMEKELGLKHEDAEMLFVDLIRFLYLCALWKGKKAFYPPPMIDQAWHEFVVHTMDYYKFCQVNFGFFLHHVPFTDDNLDLQARVESARPLAVLHFGELSPFWQENGKDCSQCGDCSPVACGHR